MTTLELRIRMSSAQIRKMWVLISSPATPLPPLGCSQHEGRIISCTWGLVGEASEKRKKLQMQTGVHVSQCNTLNKLYPLILKILAGLVEVQNRSQPLVSRADRKSHDCARLRARGLRYNRCIAFQYIRFVALH